MSTSDGRGTNAVYGFTSMLAIVLASRPEFAIAAFDLGKPTFRSHEYEEYKAGRRAMPDDLRPQIEMVREVLDSFAIPIYGVEGFAADDVTGTLARTADGYAGTGRVGAALGVGQLLGRLLPPHEAPVPPRLAVVPGPVAGGLRLVDDPTVAAALGDGAEGVGVYTFTGGSGRGCRVC